MNAGIASPDSDELASTATAEPSAPSSPNDPSYLAREKHAGITPARDVELGYGALPGGPLDGSEPVDEKAAAAAAVTFPNGGFQAWKTVLGAWCISFLTWGYVNAFGTLQAYFETHQLANDSQANISLIGSFQLAMVLACSIIAGRAFDAGYYRWLLGGGSLLYIFGIFGLSGATEYYQVFLSQGVAIGVASGIMFVPAVSCVGHFFRENRATALGVLATGSSTGGVIYPLALNRMFNYTNIGYGWTVRIIGFMNLALLLTGCICLKTRLPPRKGGKFVEFKYFKDPLYASFVAGASLVMCGLYTPMFYIQTYAASHGVDKNTAFYALSILNGASLFGRIIPNAMADHYGPLTVLTPLTTVGGILVLLWLLMGKSEGPLIAFSVIFGFCSGAFVSMIPAVVASITTDMREMGIRLSMVFLIVAPFGLIGTPISGAILRRTGSYSGAAIESAVLVLVGCAFLLTARQLAVKRKGTQWV